MGVSKELKEARGPGSRRRSPIQNKFPNSITFHPSRSEAESLKSIPMDLEKDLECLSTYLDSGCVLSLGVRQDSGSYYATLRLKTSSWMDAPAVTCWHSELTQAVKGLAFCLALRYPDFPDNLPSRGAYQDEW